MGSGVEGLEAVRTRGLQEPHASVSPTLLEVRPNPPHGSLGVTLNAA